MNSDLSWKLDEKFLNTIYKRTKYRRMSKDYIQLSAGLSQEIKDSVNIKNILDSMC